MTKSPEHRTESPEERAERRERESFDHYRKVADDAVMELIIQHNVPVEAANRMIYDVQQAAWSRGWDVAVRPMTMTKES
jgi:hypothetical protein